MHPMSARQGGGEVGAAPLSDPKAGAQMYPIQGAKHRHPQNAQLPWIASSQP